MVELKNRIEKLESKMINLEEKLGACNYLDGGNYFQDKNRVKFNIGRIDKIEERIIQLEKKKIDVKESDCEYKVNKYNISEKISEIGYTINSIYYDNSHNFSISISKGCCTFSFQSWKELNDHYKYEKSIIDPCLKINLNQS